MEQIDAVDPPPALSNRIAQELHIVIDTADPRQHTRRPPPAAVSHQPPAARRQTPDARRQADARRRRSVAAEDGVVDGEVGRLAARHRTHHPARHAPAPAPPPRQHRLAEARRHDGRRSPCPAAARMCRTSAQGQPRGIRAASWRGRAVARSGRTPRAWHSSWAAAARACCARQRRPVLQPALSHWTKRQRRLALHIKITALPPPTGPACGAWAVRTARTWPGRPHRPCAHRSPASCSHEPAAQTARHAAFLDRGERRLWLGERAEAKASASGLSFLSTLSCRARHRLVHRWQGARASQTGRTAAARRRRRRARSRRGTPGPRRAAGAPRVVSRI